MSTIGNEVMFLIRSQCILHLHEYFSDGDITSIGDPQMHVKGPLSHYRELEIHLVAVKHLHLFSFVSSDVFLVTQEQTSA